MWHWPAGLTPGLNYRHFADPVYTNISVSRLLVRRPSRLCRAADGKPVKFYSSPEGLKYKIAVPWDVQTGGSEKDLSALSRRIILCLSISHPLGLYRDFCSV